MTNQAGVELQMRSRDDDSGDASTSKHLSKATTSRLQAIRHLIKLQPEVLSVEFRIDDVSAGLQLVFDANIRMSASLATNVIVDRQM